MHRAALIGCLLAVCAGSARACGAVEFEPGPMIQADRLPDLRWRPLAGASAYLVELTARVPEGPLVDRRVQRVELPQVERPRLDDARPTKITLSVAAQCGSAQGPRVERIWLVMPSARCPAIERLVVEAGPAQTRVMRWQAQPGEVVEVRAFDAQTGGLKSIRQITASNEAPAAGPSTVQAVRRLCGTLAGPFAYLFVD